MAITYPIAFPTRSDGSSIIKSYELEMVHKVGVTESPFTFKQQIQDYNASRWELTFTTVPLYGADALNVRGFLQSLKGRLGMFYFPIPQDLGTDYQVSTTTNAGSPTVRIMERFMHTITHDFVRGTYFSLNNRLYMALEDYVSGTTDMEVTPKLRTQASSGIFAYTTNPIGTFRLADNSASFSVDVTEGHSVTVACEEALVD